MHLFLCPPFPLFLKRDLEGNVKEKAGKGGEGGFRGSEKDENHE